MPTASVAKTNPPAGPRGKVLQPLSISVSVSGDDASSAGGSAPASPRSVQPAPPAYQAAPEPGKADLMAVSPAPPASKAKTAATCAVVPNPLATIPSPPAYSLVRPAGKQRSPKSEAPKSLPPKPPAPPVVPMAKTISQRPLAGTAPVVRPTVSLASLLSEKQTLLASFEAKFNEKILSRHRELMEEQRRAALESNDRDGSLSEEVRRLKDELEEQKFSHQVELSLEKKKVEKLEEELSGTQRHRPEPASVNADKRVKELEAELRREKSLRIDQLKSLEQLHFAEFREIEQKHAEFVTQLVASYQNEIRVLKDNIKDGEDKSNVSDRMTSFEGQPSDEHAEAAAALSALAGPPAAPAAQSSDFAGGADGSSAPVNVSIRLPTLLNCAESYEAGTKRDRNMFSTAKDSPTISLNVSEVSDSGSFSGDNEEPELPPVAKKARSATQKKTGKNKEWEQVESILRKAGKMPQLSPKCLPLAKNPKPEQKRLSDATKEYLRAWMLSPEHCDHPYPTAVEKATIMGDTGIGYTELNNWFVNNRKRFWKEQVKPKIPDIKKADRMKKMKESYESCSSREQS
mmetsp:Transcript_35789/g.76433  ORF Transcript_35789/g.76433 Transcript_35789/m.76433 type:complete len:574 (-) Transcript_35789:127-1848(-)